MSSTPSHEVNMMIADGLTAYVEAHQLCVVSDNMDYARYKKGVETIEKACKRLRKGKKLNKVFDPDEIEMAMPMLEHLAATANKPNYTMGD